MSKKHWPYIIAFGAVIIACLLGLFWQSRRPKNIAEIYLEITPFAPIGVET